MIPPWSSSIVRVYAGIGSRKTPGEILSLMRVLGSALAKLGMTLRTGGADGPDSAFAYGAHKSGGEIELYLPWPQFRSEGRVPSQVCMERPSDRAVAVARRHHPRWSSLSQEARLLHGRNVHQVLGSDCSFPVGFVLCWTPDGAVDDTTAETGGTGQAIRIASSHGVPVFNLKRGDHLQLFRQLL